MTQKAKTKPQPKAVARRPQTKSAKYYYDSLEEMLWHWSFLREVWDEEEKAMKRK